MGEPTVAYCPPLCVWKVIEESTSLEKLPIIRSLIGESKVEYASDLRRELDTLIEIWYELNSGTVLTVHYSKRKSALPEPPQQREMLIAEIHLLLESLKDNENGGLVTIPTDLDETVINYANHIAAEQQPPPTTAPFLRSVSRNSSTPALNNAEIEDVARNIPVFDNEGPISALRNAIQCECEILLEDIEYVRRCVEEGRCDFEEFIEPSLIELRQERKKLEDHLLKSIELTPALARKDSEKSSLSKLKKRKTNSVTKTLPPVRPSSALQFTKRSSVDGNQNPTKISPAHKVIPKGTTSPALGSKSRTYPGETEMNLVKNVRRRNSASVILGRKGLKNEDLDHSIASGFDNKFDSLPGTRVFCGTPDSGVSSRAPSELEMAEGAVSDSLEHLKSLSKDLSEIQLTRPSDLEGHISSPYKKLHGENMADHSDASPNLERTEQNSTAHVPMPPRQKKTSTKPSTRFHRVKASGVYGL